MIHANNDKSSSRIHRCLASRFSVRCGVHWARAAQDQEATMGTWPRRVCAVSHRRSRACCTRPSRTRLLNRLLTTPPPPFRARRGRQGAAPETRYLLRTPCHHGRRLTLRCRGNPAARRAGHGIGAAQPHAQQRVLLGPGVSHLYFSLPSDAVNSCVAHLREHLPTRVRHWRPESEIRLATMPIITAMLCRRARLVPNQESVHDGSFVLGVMHPDRVEHSKSARELYLASMDQRALLFHACWLRSLESIETSLSAFVC